MQGTSKVQQHTNQIRHTNTTQHKLTPNTLSPLSKQSHTLYSVLFCSVLFPTTPTPMDCWSSPLPLHDEFEKLVIRMNPPRLATLPSLILFLLLCTAGRCLCSVIVFHVVFFLLPCRVAVDNVSSRTDTVIKVLNSPPIGLVFSALQKGRSV